MGQIVVAIGLVLAILCLVPLLLYRLAGVPPAADESCGRTLLGIFLAKVGTAIALIYLLGCSSIGRRWALYALLCWCMSAF